MKLKLIGLSTVIFIADILVAQSDEGVRKFSTMELLPKVEDQHTSWYTFLDEQTMSAAVFFLQSGKEDTATRSYLDQVYYFLSGKAQLNVGDKMLSVATDSITYVRAGTKHYFTDVSADILAIVVTSKARSNASDTMVQSFSMHQIESLGKSNNVVWNPFLRRHSLVFGLYMMPLSTGGDSTQIHPIDEINIVTMGSSKFSVDGKSMDIKRGDIVYVRKQQGHYFYDLKSDLDVLILFETKSLQK